MGYRGKVEERERARQLRADGWTMPDIAEELGVSRSSVSLWTREVPIDAALRRSPRTGRRPRGSDHPMRRRKLEQIARYDAEGRQRLARLDDRELLIAGVALYAGEGAKNDGCVSMANTNPELLRLFVTWLRRCSMRAGCAAVCTSTKASIWNLPRGSGPRWCRSHARSSGSPTGRSRTPHGPPSSIATAVPR